MGFLLALFSCVCNFLPRRKRCFLLIEIQGKDQGKFIAVYRDVYGNEYQGIVDKILKVNDVLVLKYSGPGARVSSASMKMEDCGNMEKRPQKVSIKEWNKIAYKQKSLLLKYKAIDIDHTKAFGDYLELCKSITEFSLEEPPEVSERRNITWQECEVISNRRKTLYQELRQLQEEYYKISFAGKKVETLTEVVSYGDHIPNTIILRVLAAITTVGYGDVCFVTPSVNNTKSGRECIRASKRT